VQTQHKAPSLFDDERSTLFCSAAAPLPIARKKRGLWTDSRELGLALGLLCGKYLLNSSHLHYGYWPADLPVKLSNLATAQQRLSNFILAHIPPRVASILDVGCGAGALASQMLSRGYSVDCVCPNQVLARQARKLLRDRSQICECTYEALESERRYDLIMFSESFQYTHAQKALENTLCYTRPHGYLLICDFFKTDAPGRCVMGGGQSLAAFYELISRYPFQKIKDIDITTETAPTIDLVNNLLANVAPTWRFLRRCLGGPNSFVCKMAGEKFTRKLEKIERKYFSGLRTAEHFATFKSYRLLLYQRQS
jgi:SAM-dependent methyltransferase